VGNATTPGGTAGLILLRCGEQRMARYGTVTWDEQMLSSTDKVAEQILALIAQRKLAIGATLPSGRELERVLGATHSSVTRAMLQLEARGVVQRRGYKATLRESGSTAPVRPPKVMVVSIFEAMLRGAQESAAVLGVELQTELIDVDFPAGKLRRILNQTDGPVVWAADLHSALLRSLKRPVVTVGELLPGMDGVRTPAGQLEKIAMRHAAASGHRRVGYVFTPGPTCSTETLVRAAAKEAGVELVMTAAMESSEPSEVVQKSDRWLAQARALRTTLILAGSDHHARGVEAALKRSGVSVPAQMSTICNSDVEDRLRNSTTDSVTDDWPAITLTALAMLLRRTARRRSLPATHVEVAPVLKQRGSVKRLDIEPGVGSGRSKTSTNEQLDCASVRWSASTHERIRQAAALGETVHESVGRVKEMVKIDLSTSVNRAVARPNGFFGPRGLFYFRAGVRVLHGVPFDVAAAGRPSQAGAIVIASEKMLRGDLPTRARIEVRAGVSPRVVYLLHACGFAQVRGACAVVRFEFESPGESLDVEMKMPGRHRRREGYLASSAYHVQDWWPAVPVLRGRRVLPVLVSRDGDPGLYERYLYTIEIPVPAGRGELRSLEVTMGDAPSMYAVLGLTLGV
jgi:DNA-binding LacI/PurR family transcriptional regulator